MKILLQLKEGYKYIRWNSWDFVRSLFQLIYLWSFIIPYTLGQMIEGVFKTRGNLIFNFLQKRSDHIISFDVYHDGDGDYTLWITPIILALFGLLYFHIDKLLGFWYVWASFEFLYIRYVCRYD